MVRNVFLLAFAVVFSYSQPLMLTTYEKQLLRTNPLICTSTALWPPFNTMIDGELTGIGIDYWRKITEKLNIPFKCIEANSWSEVLDSIRSGKYDLTISGDITPERSKYAVFTKSYTKYPYVIVTQDNIGFVYDARLLKGKKIAVGKGYVIDSVLKRNYRELDVISTESLEEALDMVESGEAFAAIDALPVMAYLLNSHAYGSLKISGLLTEHFSPRIMLRESMAPLLPLINKAIDAITLEEQNEINEKWISIDKNYPPSYLAYAAVIVAVLALFSYLYYRMRRLNKEIDTKDKNMKHLEKIASFDSLTLVYNRHMLDTILDQHLAMAQRYRQLLSVIFFDINDFKGVNDTYGHNAGDDVLIELTRLVSGFIRGSDIFGRWGGDEFLIILPETSQKQAKRLADTIDQRIRRHTFSALEHVSCSFGVVSHQYGDTAKDLLGRADAKLYEAKKNRKKQLLQPQD